MSRQIVKTKKGKGRRSTTDELADSQLATQKQLNSVVGLQMAFATAQKEVVASQRQTGQQLNGVVSSLNESRREFKGFQTSTTAELNSIGSKVHQVDEKVDSVTRVVEEIQKGSEETRLREVKGDTKRRLLMSPIASLTNTKTAVIGCMPVVYTDMELITHFLMVISIPVLLWYHLDARPDKHDVLTETNIRHFFRADEDIKIYPDFPHDDFTKILKMTPFRPHKVDGEVLARQWNRDNLIIADGMEFKKMEKQNDLDYPSRPRDLRLGPGKSKHGYMGNKIAYTQASEADLSSGVIGYYGESFSMDQKALMPATKHEFTKELLLLEGWSKMYDISPELKGKCHVEGGRVTPSAIKTHAEAYTAKHSSILAAMRSAKKAKAAKAKAKATATAKAVAAAAAASAAAAAAGKRKR